MHSCKSKLGIYVRMCIYTTLTLQISVGQYYHITVKRQNIECHDNRYRRNFSMPKYRYCEKLSS